MREHLCDVGIFFGLTLSFAICFGGVHAGSEKMMGSPEAVFAFNRIFDFFFCSFLTLSGLS